MFSLLDTFVYIKMPGIVLNTGASRIVFYIH